MDTTKTGTFVGFNPNEYSSTDHYFRERDTDSVDLRLLSSEDKKLFNGTTDWVVGLYVKQTDEDLLRQYTFASGDFRARYELDTQAAYAQLDTQLTERLILTSA